MTTMLSNRRSKFGMTLTNAIMSSSPLNGLIIIMSGKFVTFGIVRNVAFASSCSSLFRR